ncbi:MULTISPECIES: hypothetical protein [Kosakonia]|uniref:hypothetical protein n=1 Tax=Kosakonia TaxID=1330547 RepID=UPI0005F0B852|nr:MULTISPECIES: hypothetical protein [Kosakonia]RCX06053.1 hypothetical protein DFO56_101189 [Kosakonia sp. AG348]
MTIVFIPSLVALLVAQEKETGRELSRYEVESIRDNATAINLPTDIAHDMLASRGYSDLDAENIWVEWLAYKNRAL